MCPTCGLPNFSYETVPLAQPGLSTRLVRLHPARSLNADIVVDLKLHVGPRSEFEALSWCWGREQWNRPIRIRGDSGDQCLKVSGNLDTALRRLRLADKFRTLWVDAVCIDQLNTTEKSRQVPMMSEIYGKAMRVCVWLGEGDENSRKAVHFIRNHVLDLKKFDKICGDQEFRDQWMALVQFMERPWFSRRWVIQEIALANREAAILVCGEDIISWSKFSMAVLLFHRALSGPLSQSRLPFLLEPEDASFTLRYAPALGAIQIVKAVNDLFRNTYHHGGPIPLRSLEYLVSSFTMYETSEPRDVIFSLLSISKDAFRSDETAVTELTDLPFFENMGPDTRKAISLWIKSNLIRRPFQVDYSAPVLEVYKQFISFSVPRANPSRALDIICRPWAPSLASESFPSWIATLENAAYKPVDHIGLGRRLVRRNPDPLVGDAEMTIFSASRAIGPPKENKFFKYWNWADRSMFVDGFVLDTISTLEFPSQLGHIPPEWPDLVGWKPGSGVPPPEEFWRTIVADRGPDGKDPPPFYGPACQTVFQHAMDDTLDTAMLINHGSSVIADFLKRVQAVIWNRRLMRTGRGWLGLAPKAAQEGDLVCILYGCSVPVVLRMVNKTQVEMDKEVADEEGRRADLVAYIGKSLAAKVRRRREAKAQEKVAGSVSRSGGTRPSDDDQLRKARKRKLPPELSPADPGENSSNKASRPILALNPVEGRTAPEFVRLGYHYRLVGECYVHGMMNGEALTFRWNYNAGKPIGDRMTHQTFELK